MPILDSDTVHEGVQHVASLSQAENTVSGEIREEIKGGFMK